jgi:hypothetical protein
MNPEKLERPHFITIGAMKCATSTLHDQLALQPGVYLSEPKEPCFFSDDPSYARGAKWYEDLFLRAPPGAICGESSTHYTKLPSYPLTAQRMLRHLRSDIKLIYLMRHPIDRVVSQYVHEWAERVVSVPIDAALESRPELIEYSRYARQLRPFLDAFGPERILPVFVTQLEHDPQGTLERVGRFLGLRSPLRWIDAAGRANVSAQRMRRSAMRDRVLGVGGLARLRRHLVPRKLSERIKGLWRIGDRPRLSPESRRRLAAVFDEDLASLGSWLGVDLRCENFDQLTRSGQLRWTAATAAEGPRTGAEVSPFRAKPE